MYYAIFFTKGIITILLVASRIVDQRASLGSFPTPTIKFIASGVNTIEFINPTILTSNNKFNDLNELLHFHTLTVPLFDPKKNHINQ